MSDHIGLSDAFIVIFAGCGISATILMTMAVMHVSKDFRAVDLEIREIKRTIEESLRTDARFNFQSEMLGVLASNLFCTNALLHAFFSAQAEGSFVQSDVDLKERYSILLAELHLRNLEVAENIDFFKVLVDPTDEAIEILAEKRPGGKTLVFLRKLASSSSVESKGRLRAKFEDVISRHFSVDSSKWTGR